MTEMTLYYMVKDAILSAAACPDGILDRACPSCAARAVADMLVLTGVVEMSDPSASI